MVIGHSLPPSGDVSVTDKLVTFSRPLVTEEYSVSVDGVRQDFVIAARPAGAGDLSLELALSGAKAEVASYGARLTLDGSGRALAYSRLRVVDAKGREFVASLHVLTASRLAVRVQDAGAAYPLRIDPTFSDANWVSLSMGMNGAVQALAVSGTNLYVGGSFTTVGVANTNCIAQWNGSAWSSLGTGISTGTIVNALALDGSGNLYAGGTFTAAGGVAASNIAQWNGSAWSALGSGVTANVYALLMNGTTLYVAGQFSRAGGVTVNEIAQWNGSTWAALGTGLNNTAIAMALSGTTLYVGGLFTTAGGVAVSNIAQWNISTSTWSALGTGLNAQVHALALSGTTLYAGGNFGTAGGVSASEIAQWNITTSAWSALGTGLNGDPWGLMVTGTTLYVGETLPGRAE